MWIKILKYAGQAALALGLHDKALNWVRRKLAQSEKKTFDKLSKTQAEIDSLENEVRHVVVDPTPWKDLED